MISHGLAFSNGRQKYGRNCIGNGTGKENERQCHTGEDTVYRQGRGIIQSVKTQMSGNENGLYTVEKIYQKAVAGQGKRKAYYRFKVRKRGKHMPDLIVGFGVITEDNKTGKHHGPQFTA